MHEPLIHHDVVCPFCSLGCDDLTVEQRGVELRVTDARCGVSAAAFARAPGDATPRVDGAAADLDAAVARAAGILRDARLPLLAGLGTDTAGARAAVALAERCGGIFDHVAAAGLVANTRAMQDHGWVTGTLAEVRKRATLVLMVATDAREFAARFEERILRHRPDRRVVVLGDVRHPPDGAEVLSCPPGRLAEAVAALRALVAERPVPEPVPGLADLARDLRACPYSAVVWSTAELPQPHADLVVGQLAQMLQELNLVTRSVGLPLAARDNPIGVNQVCAWTTGVPLPSSLATGAPDHDPALYATEPLLASGAVDALIWLASIHDHPPPATDLPTIALIRAGAPVPPATVVIPVGVPGLDHAGSVYRQDGVVALPLRPLREPTAPGAAAILSRITAAL